MANRYFATNSLAGGERNSVSVTDGDTTAGRFDSTYVANAIKNVSGGSGINYYGVKQPFADGSTSITGTLWLRFDSYNTFNGGGLIPFVFLLNAGVNAYRICTGGAGTCKMQYWNTVSAAWVDWGSTFSVTDNVNATYVAKIVLNTSFQIYLGGSLVASSAVVPTNGVTAVTDIRFFSTNGTSYFSQIMGADYDIRDSHYMATALNGNSAANTDGTGVYTDVNEAILDDSTAIALPAVGNKRGQTKASLTLPSGFSIAGLVINARGRVSGGVVADGKLLVRSGGTNYLSSAKVFTSGYEPRGNIWITDPATSSGFSQTGFNNAEVGLQAS